jgi:hypothetical protein
VSNALRIASTTCLLLWFVGTVSGHSMGGFIHAFLVFGLLLGVVCFIRHNDVA